MDKLLNFRIKMENNYKERATEEATKQRNKKKKKYICRSRQVIFKIISMSEEIKYENWNMGRQSRSDSTGRISTILLLVAAASSVKVTSCYHRTTSFSVYSLC